MLGSGGVHGEPGQRWDSLVGDRPDLTPDLHFVGRRCAAQNSTFWHDKPPIGLVDDGAQRVAARDIACTVSAEMLIRPARASSRYSWIRGAEDVGWSSLAIETGASVTPRPLAVARPDRSGGVHRDK